MKKKIVVYLPLTHFSSHLKTPYYYLSRHKSKLGLHKFDPPKKVLHSVWNTSNAVICQLLVSENGSCLSLLLSLHKTSFWLLIYCLQIQILPSLKDLLINQIIACLSYWMYKLSNTPILKHKELNVFSTSLRF